MKNAQEIIEVVNAAHGNAIDKGWWEKERTLGELVSLIHTEASEAMEDFRNGHKPTQVWYEYKQRDIRGNFEDDDFPIIGVGPGGLILSIQPSVTEGGNVLLGKPCGIPSELADIVIRVFDLVGKYEVVEPFANFSIQMFHNNVDYAIEPDRPFGDNMGWLHASISKILTDSMVEYAAETVYHTYKLAEYNGIDLDAIIAEKMEFNKSRTHRHGGKLL